MINKNTVDQAAQDFADRYRKPAVVFYSQEFMTWGWTEYQYAFDAEGRETPWFDGLDVLKYSITHPANLE